MVFMRRTRVTLVLALVIVLTSACAGIPAQQGEAGTEESLTGVPALDEIIGLALAGDTEGLREKIHYTTAACTMAEGLGGPPKCAEGQSEGALVEALPFLGPEGHFILKDDISSWTGVDAASLYAVYQVSESAYSEVHAPRGEYALVFRTAQPSILVTLQITDGHIVRVDASFGSPPAIQEADVAAYLLPPSTP